MRYTAPMSVVIKNGTYKMENQNQSNILDLKEYKLAKIFCGDLAKVIPRVEASLLVLKPYARYSQVQSIIAVMETRLGILQAQYNKYKKVLDSKGKR